ncbi:MAG: hypothetical protein JWN78_2712 [Bacteroidota bacterium]|nr:hypothetical protein [Bacteroidota bacterium]
MAGHAEIHPPVPNKKRLPNQHFWGWLKNETALFISQIITILGIILYLATFSYYVFGHDESKHAKSYEEYLDTTKHVIFYCNIFICLLLILILTHILYKNDIGEHNARKAFERIFRREENAEDMKRLEKAKESIKEFKVYLRLYWIFGIIYYLVFLVLDYKENIIPQEAKDCIAICLNTLGAMIIFLCYRVIIISNTPPSKDNISLLYRNWFIVFIYLIFVVFVGITLIYGHHPFKYMEMQLIWLAISGVLNMICIAMLIARLDSKLIGVPSWLITLIYGYAIIQSLFPLFDAHPAIESIVFFLGFIFKIYFMIVIIYMMQTGRMLNFFYCSSVITKITRENRIYLFK